MQHQSKLDKKNIIQSQARERRALLEQRTQNSTKSSKIVKKSLTPTLTIPPVPRVNPTLSATYTVASTIPGVDMSRVRSTWLGWYNDIRQSEWLGRYEYDSRLDSTAHDWNIRFAEWSGLNHHRRNPWDSYYDFSVVDQWFIARRIDPRIINRAKHTENVGYGHYSCNSTDCTETLIRSIRSTFDFFMSEKGKAYDAHYRSIIQPYFTRIGLDIIIVPSERRYYLTVHYITE
jgi:hypothetical protein